jgi:uncharacterized protein YukE
MGDPGFSVDPAALRQAATRLNTAGTDVDTLDDLTDGGGAAGSATVAQALDAFAHSWRAAATETAHDLHELAALVGGAATVYEHRDRASAGALIRIGG